MPYRNTTIAYGSVTKWLHWIIALLVITLLAVGFFMDDITPDPTKFMVYNIHKLIGLTVLTLMLIRIVWTLGNKIPPLPGPVAGWERVLLNTVKILFYIVLVFMPLSGWIMTTAEGRAPHLFGLKLNAPGIPLDKHLADISSNIHAFLGWTILVLIGLHVAGALKHLIINKTNLYKRILPSNWFES